MIAQRFEDVTKQVVGSQHSRRRLLRGLGGGLAGAAVAGAGPRMAGSEEATPASMDTNDGDFAGLVDIGGRSFYLEIHGAGGPTVVFESGFRDSGASWSTDLLTETGATPAAPRTMVLLVSPPSRASLPTIGPARPSTSITSAAAIPSPCRVPRPMS